MMNLTIKMSLLIINLYMINAYKICPRNSYYKVVDFSANYGFGLNNVHMHEGFTHKIDRISTQISVFKLL